MAEEVTIQRQVEVDIEVCVYSVTCDCGEGLLYDVKTDGNGDLVLTVEEHMCVQEDHGDD